MKSSFAEGHLYSPYSASDILESPMNVLLNHLYGLWLAWCGNYPIKKKKKKKSIEETKVHQYKVRTTFRYFFLYFSRMYVLHAHLKPGQGSEITRSQTNPLQTSVKQKLSGHKAADFQSSSVQGLALVLFLADRPRAALHRRPWRRKREKVQSRECERLSAHRVR